MTGVALRTLALITASVALTAAESTRFIDLSRDQARQVVVDREAGQYLGHPTTLLLEDGRTLLCVYPKGHGEGAILYKRSTDGGRTWSARLPVPASWETSRETPTLHRVIDAAGHRRIILFSGLYPIRMSVSEDDGLTWSELKPIGTFGGIVAMASVVELKTGPGHYMALFHDDGRFIANGGSKTGRFTVYKTLSRDGGLTWSQPAVVASSSEVDLCEPGAFRSPDGRTIAVLLRENRRVRRSHIIVSGDEGQTWSEPREVSLALTGDRHVAKYAPDGRLVVSFRDLPPKGTASETAGDWMVWVGRWEDVVGGGDGQYRVRLADNADPWDAAYPGVERLGDGTFVATTYGHWVEGQEPFVLSVRFRLEELDRLGR